MPEESSGTRISAKSLKRNTNVNQSQNGTPRAGAGAWHEARGRAWDFFYSQACPANTVFFQLGQLGQFSLFPEGKLHLSIYFMGGKRSKEY